MNKYNKIIWVNISIRSQLLTLHDFLIEVIVLVVAYNLIVTHNLITSSYNLITPLILTR